MALKGRNLSLHLIEPEWDYWCERERDKLPVEVASPPARASPGVRKARATLHEPASDERPGPIKPELLGPLLSALGTRSSALPLTAQGA